MPETFLGKLIGASSMLVGIFVLALPISVISTTFGEVWHEWKEELRLEAQSREEDLRSVELALQIIENRTHMVVEIYDHSDRYPPEFLGQVAWKSLPLDSKETVDCPDQSFPIKSSLSLHRHGLWLHTGHEDLTCWYANAKRNSGLEIQDRPAGASQTK